MRFFNSLAMAAGKQIVFSGRATRTEYFSLVCLCALGSLMLWLVLFMWMGIVTHVVHETLFAKAPITREIQDIIIFDWNVKFSACVAFLAIIWPVVAAGSRRLHDAGRSGWWQILVLTGVGTALLIYWLARPSHTEQNRYGTPPDPDRY